MSEDNRSRAARLADQFKAASADLRTEVDLPIPGIPGRPDFRFRCVLRRVDILSFITNSSLPEHLVRSLLNLRAPDRLEALEKQAAETAAKMVSELETVEDLKAIQQLQRTIAQATCLEPRIVYEPTDDPEAINLDESDIGDAIVKALYAYATSLSPDVPVAMAGGEATLDEVSSFRMQ